MPKFEITAKADMNYGGKHIPKGDTFTINVNVGGIGPNDFFGNSRCTDSLRRQLAQQDIYVAPNSGALNGGMWNIKMVK